MAALFRDLSTIAANAGFQGRVQYAFQVAAVNVMAEASNTAKHEQRVDYARKVLAGNVSLLEQALAVLTNATIAAEAVVATTPDYAIPDGDIQFAVNTLFNAMAGIST